MHLIRVTDHSTASEFLNLPLRLNNSPKNVIRSQQKSIKDLISKKTAPLTKGVTECWILSNFRGQTIGRIMAVLDQSGPTAKGYFALFECIDHLKAARLLLEECASWLHHFGVSEMTGPLNLLTYHQGWLSVEEPDGGSDTHHDDQISLYTDLLKKLGLSAKIEEKLLRYDSLEDAIPGDQSTALEKNSIYTFEIPERNRLYEAAQQVEQIIAASHSDIPRINADEIIRWLRQLREVSYHPLLCMAYHNEQPVGASIMISVADVKRLSENFSSFSFWQNLRGHYPYLLNLMECTSRDTDQNLLHLAFLQHWDTFFKQKKHSQFEGVLLLREASEAEIHTTSSPEVVHNYYKFDYRFDQHALIGSFAGNKY